MAGAFVTVDGHTTIDTPHAAFTRFCSRVYTWKADPYLPFSCGLIGYIGFEAARALRGLEPAAGFSRHPQCKAGIYDAAVVFDHAEGTSWIVANGDDHDKTTETALKLLEHIRSDASGTQDSARNSVCISGVRMSPEEAHFRKTLDAARSWIRSDLATRLHLVRHAAAPLSETTPLSHFMGNEHSQAVEAFFTHEGSSFALSSRDVLVHVEENVLSSLLPVAPTEGHPRRDGTLRALREFKSFLADICKYGYVVSDEVDAAAKKQFVRFGGTLDRNLSALDAVIAMLPSHAATGTPYECALNFIGMSETAHRSFYGGAFGTMDAIKCRFRTIEKVRIYADGSVSTTAGIDMDARTDPQEILLHFNEALNAAQS